MLPCELLRFLAVRFSVPATHAEKIQPHMGVWICVGLHDPGISALNLDAEFFVQFARDVSGRLRAAGAPRSKRA